MSIKILHISDCHGKNIKLPKEKFQFFIETGDFSAHDISNFTVDSQYNRYINKDVEAKFQKHWFIEKRIPFYQKVDAQHKVVLFGNHDFWTPDDLINGIHISRTTKTITVGGLKIGILAGSNIIKNGGIVGGWNDEISEEEFRNRILSLDSDIDILISHQPPYGIFDNAFGIRLGSFSIYDSIFGLIGKPPFFTKLKAHLFGHIHENSGIEVREIEERKITFSNASRKYNILEV